MIRTSNNTIKKTYEWPLFFHEFAASPSKKAVKMAYFNRNGDFGYVNEALSNG